jgi:hypothetical protein
VGALSVLGRVRSQLALDRGRPCGSEIHAAHASAGHAARGRLVVSRKLAHRRFGCDEQAGDRGRVLERVQTTLVGSIALAVTKFAYVSV